MSHDDMSSADVLRDIAEEMEAMASELARLRGEVQRERGRADDAERRWATWSGRDAAEAAEAAVAEARRATEEWSERTLYRPSESVPGWVLTMSGYGRTPATREGWLSVHLDAATGSWAWGLGVHGVRVEFTAGFPSPQAAAAAADAAYPQEVP